MNKLTLKDKSIKTKIEIKYCISINSMKILQFSCKELLCITDTHF